MPSTPATPPSRYAFFLSSGPIAMVFFLLFSLLSEQRAAKRGLYQLSA
jgi:hypothetical protein